MKRLLTVFILFAFLITSAQTKFGITVGINIANMKEKVDDKKHLRTFIPRIEIGSILEIPINENWILHTSPYYSGKGCRYGNTFTTKNDSIRIHLNYIELPLQILYKFSSEKLSKVLIGGGCYVAYGFNGAVLYKDDVARTKKYLHRKNSYYKRWDFGYSLNSSYQYNNKYGIKAGFSHSLLNILRNGDADYKAKNIVFNISLTGFIGKVKRKSEASE
jgi:hypothetical protein